jgi:hypothetical protein
MDPKQGGKEDGAQEEAVREEDHQEGSPEEGSQVQEGKDLKAEKEEIARLGRTKTPNALPGKARPRRAFPFLERSAIRQSPRLGR